MTAQKLGELVKMRRKKLGLNQSELALAAGTGRRFINGQVTTEMTDSSPKACKDGVIGIQMHAGYTMTLQVKDIKIKMLDKK